MSSSRLHLGIHCKLTEQCELQALLQWTGKARKKKQKHATLIDPDPDPGPRVGLCELLGTQRSAPHSLPRPAPAACRLAMALLPALI